MLQAAAAGFAACERLRPAELPERAVWLHNADALARDLYEVLCDAPVPERETIVEYLDDIVAGSLDGRDLLKRLLLLTVHARDYLQVRTDSCWPAVVRTRASELGFRPFDLVSRVRRDEAIECIAIHRNEIFEILGIRPRSLRLLDWCEVAVRRAMGGPMHIALASLDPEDAQELWDDKLRFDLLAIELNIALDDLADDGRDAGLFALVVTQVFGSDFARETFREDTAVGRYFLEQLEKTEQRIEDGALGDERVRAVGSYIALVDMLFQQLVHLGQSLAGPRWDQAMWTVSLRRIIGAMMLSLVQNNRPDLLEGACERTDFHGPSLLRVQAANSNRFVFELVGLWCYERVTGYHLSESERDRLLGAFEDLQIAQQICNCLATLEREIDEGDRSNWVVSCADMQWRGLSIEQRDEILEDLPMVFALGVSSSSDGLVGYLYRVIQGESTTQLRPAAAELLRSIIRRTDAVSMAVEEWEDRVRAAAEVLEELGFVQEGHESTRAQIDLLLLHLLLLNTTRLSRGLERL